MTDLLTRVEQCIERQRLLADGEPVLVAVSGGVDSMVLLHVLNQLRARHGWVLTVAHFNHQLRGAESDGDERFVSRVADRLGLKFEVGRGDVRSFARERKLSMEMAARTLRHEFLATTARRLGIRAVALAHHADDQLELFFLRLFRGAGPDGLAGMKASAPSPARREITLARPLLAETKAELTRFAKAERLKFRRDRTNRSPDLLRNRIRHKLLPQLRREYQRELHGTVLRAMELMRADAEFVRASALEWIRQRRPDWAGLPVAVQRAVLHEELLRLGVSPAFDRIEQLRSSTDWVSVAPEVVCRRRSDGTVEKRTPEGLLAFDPGEALIVVDRRAGTVEFASRTVRWRRRKGNKRPATTPDGVEHFDADAVGSRIVLRHWRPGDRFQPIGMQRAVKLQDLFVNAKIPPQRRRCALVAATDAGEIFWVEGLRIGERFKITPSTREILDWRFAEA